MRLVILMAVTTTLTGCATDPQVDFKPKRLVLEEFFPGRVLARGTFKPTLTGPDRGLTVIIDSTWDGKTLTMVEDFTYDDGELDHKTWRFTRTAERTYTGTREDVLGTARTYPDGDAMRLEYKVMLKTEAYGDLHVRFRDIMALEADGTLINRAVVSKWGIKLGNVELRMTRETPPAS